MEGQSVITNEIEFCESAGCQRSENGEFIYDSRNRETAVNLPFLLMEYRDWLVKEGHVMEVLPF